MELLLSLEFIFGVSFGLLFTALRANFLTCRSFQQFVIKLISICGLVNQSMKTVLCNSNTFVKSQQIATSVGNGTVHTMVTIKIDTKIALHCLEVKPGLKR